MSSTDSPEPPASDGGAEPPRSRRALLRWAPIAAVAVLVVAGVAVSALGGGDDDEAAVAPTGTRPDGAITWSQAEDEGLDVTFPDTCDEETGRVALPFYFAPECYANVEDNGGETAMGVTGDSIKVIVYRAPEDDPVLDYVAGAAESDDTAEEMTDAPGASVAMMRPRSSATSLSRSTQTASITQAGGWHGASSRSISSPKKTSASRISLRSLRKIPSPAKPSIPSSVLLD